MGKVLKELMAEHGLLTIEEFAAHMRQHGPMSSQQAGSLWHGRAPIGGRMALRIHEVFNIPVKDLLLVNRPRPHQPVRHAV